jgi:pimeloyl-ACP methyl ester carboxylesterase
MHATIPAPDAQAASAGSAMLHGAAPRGKEQDMRNSDRRRLPVTSATSQVCHPDSGRRTVPWVSEVRAAAALAVVLLLAGCAGPEPSGASPSTGTTTTTSATTASTTTSGSSGFSTATGPHPECLTPSEQQAVEHLTVHSGATIEAVSLGRGTTAVVLGHSMDMNLCEWMPQARLLARRGYLVVAIDFEGFGESDPPAHPNAIPVDQDLLVAATWAGRHGAKKVVFMGSSMGGTAAIEAGVRSRLPVAAVVSLSGPSGVYALDAWADIPRLHAPCLLLVGSDDTDYAFYASQLSAAAGCHPASLHTFPVRAHGSDLYQATNASTVVRAFLDRYAPARS